MGLSHRFDFDGRSVEVRLPSESAADRGEGYDTVARCVRWKRHDGKKIPLAYNISKIDVSVIVKGMIEIPEKLLQLSPNQFDMITESKAEYLNSMASVHEKSAARAFDYWIRVVRWKTRFWMIGQSEVIGAESGWGTYLIDKDTKHRFWVGIRTWVADGAPIVYVDKMMSVLESARRAEVPPIWFEFLFDAEHKANIGDRNGCVLDLAIAFESLLKRLLITQISKDNSIDPQISKLLSKLGIRLVFRHIRKCDFWGAEWKGNCDVKEINDMIDCRNDIIHAGFDIKLDDDKLRKMIASVKAFIIFADKSM